MLERRCLSGRLWAVSGETALHAAGSTAELGARASQILWRALARRANETRPEGLCNVSACEARAYLACQTPGSDSDAVRRIRVDPPLRPGPGRALRRRHWLLADLLGFPRLGVAWPVGSKDSEPFVPSSSLCVRIARALRG